MHSELHLVMLTVEVAVILPHIVWKAFACSVIAVAILEETDHPHGASVYALVYSCAPGFCSRTTELCKISGPLV